MDKLKMKEIRKQVRSCETNREKLIEVYIDWFLQDCSDPKDELKWLVYCLLNSMHKEDMEDVLKTTYEYNKIILKKPK